MAGLDRIAAGAVPLAPARGAPRGTFGVPPQQARFLGDGHRRDAQGLTLRKNFAKWTVHKATAPELFEEAGDRSISSGVSLPTDQNALAIRDDAQALASWADDIIDSQSRRQRGPSDINGHPTFRRGRRDRHVRRGDFLQPLHQQSYGGGLVDLIRILGAARLDDSRGPPRPWGKQIKRDACYDGSDWPAVSDQVERQPGGGGGGEKKARENAQDRAIKAESGKIFIQRENAPREVPARESAGSASASLVNPHRRVGPGGNKTDGDGENAPTERAKKSKKTAIPLELIPANNF